MENRLVSVIVPFYNAEKFVDNIYISLSNQTYKNLELIFVDDGSIDSTLSLLKSIEKKDNRVKVIHKKNGGPGSARNFGLDVSTGYFVAFVDCDDVLDTNYIFELLTNIGDSEICICNYCKKINNNYFSPKIVKKKSVINNIKATSMYFNKKYHVLMLVPWAKIFLGDFIRKYRFDEFLKSEDEDLSYKYIFEANKITIINKILYEYKVNLNSDSSILNIRRYIDFYEILYKRQIYFCNKNKKFFTKAYLKYVDYHFSLLRRFKKKNEIISKIQNYDKIKLKFCMVLYCPFLYIKIAIKHLESLFY